MADQPLQSSASRALYALRVEGQNFKWVLYDTHDLSASAGGSRLLEEIPREVKNVFDAQFAGDARSFDQIQSASSSAVYACCCTEDKMKDVLNALRDAFRKDDFAHLTVAVAAIEVAKGGCEEAELTKRIKRNDLKRLSAAMRYAQMTAPNVAVPVDTKVKAACEKDHLRPKGAKPIYKWSDSVHARREKGKNFRRILASGAGNEQGSIGTARTFDGLTSLNKPQDPRNLKLAVISIDGIGFGGHFNRHSEDGAQLREFSDAMTKLQKGFEDSLLAKWLAMKHAPEEERRDYFIDKLSDDKFAEDKDVEELDPSDANVRLLRLQRLVTAGDDSLYLMPAWLAWEFLETFFEQKWEITIAGAHTELAFRVGMVLCHHNAPIHRIRELAGRLAYQASKDGGDKIANPIAYEVLKSFDLIGPDLAKYREDRVHRKLSPDQMLLDGKKLETMRDELRKLEQERTAGEIKDPARWKAAEAVNAYHLSQLSDFLPD